MWYESHFPAQGYQNFEWRHIQEQSKVIIFRINLHWLSNATPFKEYLPKLDVLAPTTCNMRVQCSLGVESYEAKGCNACIWNLIDVNYAKF